MPTWHSPSRNWTLWRCQPQASCSAVIPSILAASIAAQERYGKRELTLHDGDYLEIPLECEAGLVAELRERGYEVTRDDELINLLDGFSLGSLAG